MNVPVIGELGPVGLLFAAIFALSMFFGMAARKTDFCPLGGIADMVQNGNSGRFWMYFFAIATAILGVTLIESLELASVDSSRPPYRSSGFRWLGYLAGGLFFGIGMTLCRGCGMKNMINLGSGNFKALVAIAGMGTAGYLLLYVEGVMDSYIMSWLSPTIVDLSAQGLNHQDLGTVAANASGMDVATSRLIVGLVIGGLLMALALRSRDFMARKANLIGGLLIGAIIAFAFWLSGGSDLASNALEFAEFQDEPQAGMDGQQPHTQSYTFIRPMGDLFYFLSSPEARLFTFGLVAFLGVGAGSLLMSIVTGGFRFQWFGSVGEAVRFLVGGLMVGIGGIVGMGCTLGQGVAGTSTLAMGSFLNLAALIIGAYIGIKMQPRFMDDHCNVGTPKSGF